MIDAMDRENGAQGAVAITGCGVVSPVGIGTGPFWEGLEHGVRAIQPIRRFPTSSCYTSIAAEVRGEYFGKKFDDARQEGTLAGLFLEEAAAQAIAQAGLAPGAPQLSRAGFAVGTTLAQIGIFERYLEARARGESLPPGFCREVPHHRLAERLASRYGTSGFTITVNTACTSSLQAMGFCVGAIRRGMTDIAVVAGVDALSQTAFSGFACLKALSPTEVRPFDARRDGLALGEGSAAMVLENPEHARRRDAEILAIIRGYGCAGDANHISGPDRNGAGLSRAIRSCLRDSRLGPCDLDLVSAHGTGTVYNDRMESIAIKNTLGEVAHQIPAISLKSRFGHTLGAAGILEATAAVLATKNHLVLSTLNHEQGDQDCDLDYVSRGNRSRSLSHVLCLAAGFGGQNAAMILEAAHG